MGPMLKSDLQVAYVGQGTIDLFRSTLTNNAPIRQYQNMGWTVHHRHEVRFEMRMMICLM
jgi:hypothetical protein